MRFKNLALTSVFLFAVFSLSAQNSSSFGDRLDAAQKIYLSGAYYTAEQEFSKLLEESTDQYSLTSIKLKAYKLMCAINLDRINVVGLTNKFEQQYPNAVELPMVKYTLASHLFDKEQYLDALSIFETLNRDDLFLEIRTDFDFKFAFCNMIAGKYELAEKNFLDIIEQGNSPQYYPSIYYLGYVYYRDNQFEKAYERFSQSMKDTKFTLMSLYFATESKFMLKDYDYVIQQGPVLFKELESDLKSTMSRMISEAYYEKDMTNQAVEYFKIYATDATLSRSDKYFGGILAYNTANYKDAFDYFMQVNEVDDEIGQNANYYAANASLKERNKVAAMELFKAASEQGFDPIIKEDAMFNYAKLSFDVNLDISQFEKYIELYPTSGRDDDINNYMAVAFLLKMDYVSAINALQKINHMTSDAANNLQKAAFFRGMQLVESKSYRAATPFLELSLNYGRNETLRNLCNFWLAECFYRNNRFSEASDILKSLVNKDSFKKTNEYPTAIYNLAYNYFKKGDFANSQSWFQKYLNINDNKFVSDANIRLADSYFMQSKYSNAANLYEEIYKKGHNVDNTYSAYQAAVSYGLTNNTNKKIDILRQVTRNNLNSPLYCQSLYELGRTYVQKGDGQKASECFYTLVGRKSDSLYFSKALIELAMINANNGNNDAAIDFYKQIIEQAPYSEEVQDALTGLESIYLIQEEPEEFLAFLDRQNMSNMKSENEKEKMLFTTAQQQFLSRNYSKAVTSIKTFLSYYPDGSLSTQANFYLAESLKALGRKEAAADEYLNVIKSGEGEFLCSSLKNYAQINYELGNYELSSEVYENLITASKDDVMRLEGYAGKMRSFFYDRKYDKAIEVAQQIGDMHGMTPQLQREAEFIMAKSLTISGQREAGTALFEDLAKDCNDEFGAESSYTLIQNAYATGDFAKVETLVYEFVDKESPFVYWLAKSFIVLGDTYYDREDYQQARATYQSIVDGYDSTGSSDDIISQVEGRLKKMEDKK